MCESGAPRSLLDAQFEVGGDVRRQGSRQEAAQVLGEHPHAGADRQVKQGCCTPRKTPQGESWTLFAMNEAKCVHQASTGSFFSPALGLFSPPGASGGQQPQGAPMPTATPAATHGPAPGDASSCPRGLNAAKGWGGCAGERRRGQRRRSGGPSRIRLPRPKEKAPEHSG